MLFPPPPSLSLSLSSTNCSMEGAWTEPKQHSTYVPGSEVGFMVVIACAVTLQLPWRALVGVIWCCTLCPFLLQSVPGRIPHLTLVFCRRAIHTKKLNVSALNIRTYMHTTVLIKCLLPVSISCWIVWAFSTVFHYLRTSLIPSYANW